MAAHSQTAQAQPDAAEGPATSEQIPDQSGGSDHMAVSEILSDKAGAGSPFGDDIALPLPVHEIAYQLPGGADTDADEQEH